MTLYYIINAFKFINMYQELYTEYESLAIPFKSVGITRFRLFNSNAWTTVPVINSDQSQTYRLLVGIGSNYNNRTHF